MYQDHERGLIGENIACEYIIQDGMEIIERNFRCKMGEIDIIAKDKDELVFIEVKTRGQKKYGTPSEAVGKTKKKHIYRVAEYYLMINHIENVFCRLDVIEIYMEGELCKVNHLKNAILERPNEEKYEELDEEYEFEEYD